MLSNHLRNFAANKSPVNGAASFTFLDECLLEGILSRLWQIWCTFCRSCVLRSCLGTTSSTGIILTPLPTAISEDHVSSAAIRAKKRDKLIWSGTNSSLRHEPTWGDVDVLVQIITALQPANAVQMRAGFSSGYTGAKALQTIRNAAAHNHIQNLNEVMSMRSSYIVFPIAHPIQALFWIEPNSQDFLIHHAIHELENAATTAIL